MFKISLHKMTLKNTPVKLLSHRSAANEKGGRPRALLANKETPYHLLI